MRYISEAESRLLITHEIAFEAVKDAFLAAVLDNKSTVFPAVIAHGTNPINVFTIKSPNHLLRFRPQSGIILARE